jgi:hypothetical protein
MIGFIDTLYNQLVLTINYSATADFPTSQITRTSFPFPGNGFITGTITSDHSEVISCSITLECRPSRTRPNSLILYLQSHLATARLSLYRRGTEDIENTSSVARSVVLPCNEL